MHRGRWTSFAKPQPILSKARAASRRDHKQIARKFRHSCVMTGQSDGWITTARVLRRVGCGVTGRQVDAVAKQNWPDYVDAALRADPDKDPGAVATPMPTLPTLR